MWFVVNTIQPVGIKITGWCLDEGWYVGPVGEHLFGLRDRYFFVETVAVPARKLNLCGAVSTELNPAKGKVVSERTKVGGQGVSIRRSLDKLEWQSLCADRHRCAGQQQTDVDCVFHLPQVASSRAIPVSFSCTLNSEEFMLQPFPGNVLVKIEGASVPCTNKKVKWSG